MTETPITSILDDSLRSIAMQLVNKGYRVDVPEYKRITRDAIYVYPPNETIMMFAIHSSDVPEHLRVYFYPKITGDDGLSILIRESRVLVSVKVLSQLAQQSG
jgi:hypothetical protein